MEADTPVRVLCAQEECERGYNLKAAFPDFPEVLQQWQAATVAVQASLLTTRDIAYGDGPLQGFDYYQASGHARPLLIFIHGDKSDIGFIAAPYVNAGISVAVMNYSLAPSATIEDMVDEVAACLAYIVAHAALLDIDVTRISLMGHSAGAHLATYVATTTHSVPVHAVFAISGVFDLLPLLPTTINHALGLDETRANDLSPVLLNGPGKTQVHTIIGANETQQFHLQSAIFAQCWPQVVAHHVVPDTHHYTVLLPLSDAKNKVCQAIIGAVH
jgi:arylformamidase